MVYIICVFVARPWNDINHLRNLTQCCIGQNPTNNCHFQYIRKIRVPHDIQGRQYPVPKPDIRCVFFLIYIDMRQIDARFFFMGNWNINYGRSQMECFSILFRPMYFFFRNFNGSKLMTITAQTISDVEAELIAKLPETRPSILVLISNSVGKKSKWQTFDECFMWRTESIYNTPMASRFFFVAKYVSNDLVVCRNYLLHFNGQFCWNPTKKSCSHFRR